MREEVQTALARTQSGKAPGPDDVPVELFKLGGETSLDLLHSIIEKVWISGEWPEDWTRSVFVPLHKKGDSRDCLNYRTISLVSHVSKVLLQIIIERIRAKVEPELSDEQAGFRPGRGTRNHLVNLCILCEKARAKKAPLFLCFIDFEKAFDRVSHRKLWEAMTRMGFSDHLIHLLTQLYQKQQACIRINIRRSRWFHPEAGVRQRCNLSPYCSTLFQNCLFEQL